MCFIICCNTNCKLFLALFLGAAQFFDGGQCWVGIECPQHIAKIVGIDFAATVKVVDGEGEGCPYARNDQI